MSHLGEVDSWLGPNSSKPKTSTVQYKTKEAFREVGQRLGEQEILSREVREQTLNMIDAVFVKFGEWHAEMTELRARLEKAEAEIKALTKFIVEDE